MFASEDLAGCEHEHAIVIEARAAYDEVTRTYARYHDTTTTNEKASRMMRHHGNLFIGRDVLRFSLVLFLKETSGVFKQ